MKIGFIGLGAMGFPMFRNLSRQYPDALAYDLSPETPSVQPVKGWLLLSRYRRCRILTS